MNNYKKMIDWLYSKGNDVPEFQRELRFIMLNKYMISVLKGTPKSYKLSNREQSQLDRLLK